MNILEITLLKAQRAKYRALIKEQHRMPKCKRIREQAMQLTRKKLQTINRWIAEG